MTQIKKASTYYTLHHDLGAQLIVDDSSQLLRITWKTLSYTNLTFITDESVTDVSAYIHELHKMIKTHSEQY